MKKTAIHITGIHATMLMRMARQGDRVIAEPAPDHELTGLDDDVSKVEDLCLGKLCSALNITDSNPLELLVPSDASRLWSSPKTSRLRTSVLSVSLPEGSFLKLHSGRSLDAILWSQKTDIYIESPELAIIRCARTYASRMTEGHYSSLLAFLRTLAFVDECCGSYSRDPFNPQLGEVLYDEPWEPTRFTDPARVSLYLQKAHGLDGLQLARRVASYAIDESGSPMETYINHALTLPPRYAGLGLKEPLANKQLVIDDAHWARIKHGSLRPDFQWPDYNVLAEYLGEKDHASKSARMEDKNRMQDYASTSYAAFPLMFDDVRNATALNQTALMLARAFENNGSSRQISRMKKLIKDDSFLGRQRAMLGALLPPVANHEA